jgi:bifunctional DNA-binding transcriptional regulator/antitoxin component of YhaV-PrlF toxin-antitoxin module
MQIKTSVVQGRGFATIPQEVRERLGVSKGSTLSFIMFDDGRVELRADQELRAQKAIQALDELKQIFKNEGISMEAFIKQARKARRSALKSRNGKPYTKLKKF